jgi:hypothetical protein
MSSILLGTLAYSGLNNKSNTTIKKNKLDSTYNSDMENNIKILEKRQVAQNYSTPEYLSQFDDLKVDSTNGPVGINESFKGINSSLQRNIDFQKGYSEFQNTNMHYNVSEDLSHNNMIIYSSRRESGLQDVEKKNRKLEAFTGIDSNYVGKKEKVPLFEPMADLSFVNGSPVITGQLQNRYLPSNNNNYGNLPFQNKVMIKPGLGPENQQGRYAVYRINPPNVDNLRSDVNQKQTYDNKPLETIKKGGVRGPDPTISKFKVPDFRVQSVDDLVPSRSSINQSAYRGTFTNVTTQRNQAETLYMGPKINTNKGEGSNIDNTTFQKSKRENYFNDNTHNVAGVSNKPVMTNINSYTNYETQRVTTNNTHEGAVKHHISNNYTIDYSDIPLTTLRELVIYDDAGNISGPDKKNYVFSNDLCLPITKRQETTHNIVTNAAAQDKSAGTRFTDTAKPTIRQDASHSIVTNSVAQDKSGSIRFTDTAKQTIRENNSHSIVTNAIAQDKTGTTRFTDKAKPTIRQDSSHHIIANAVAQDKSGTTRFTDTAKPTIRQSTDATKQSGPAQGINYSSLYTRDESDSARPTIRQSTDATKYVGGAQYATLSSLYVRDESDSARPTIRQSTDATQYIGHAGNSNEMYVIDKEYNAKPTIKQTTLFSTPGKSVGTGTANYTKDSKDIAKTTIKQTTLLEDHVGLFHGEVNLPMSQMSAENMTIDNRREATTYNHAPNAKGQYATPYIDRENYKFREPILFTYVSHPSKKLDFSVMPTIDNSCMQQGEYYSSKPVISTSSYYINNDFINTLKNNPLVNDIYNQKNV